MKNTSLSVSLKWISIDEASLAYARADDGRVLWLVITEHPEHGAYTAVALEVPKGFNQEIPIRSWKRPRPALVGGGIPSAKVIGDATWHEQAVEACERFAERWLAGAAIGACSDETAAS